MLTIKLGVKPFKPTLTKTQPEFILKTQLIVNMYIWLMLTGFLMDLCVYITGIGISIQHSRVRAAPDFEAVKGRFKSYLGRPWKKYSRTVFLKTDIDGLIDPRGWREWSGSYALSTLYYGEFMNTGAGAGTSRRVNWPGFHVLRGEEEASPFTVSRFIQGDSWIPITGVPFSAGV